MAVWAMIWERWGATRSHCHVWFLTAQHCLQEQLRSSQTLFTAVILWVLICTPPFLKLSPSDCIAWKYCPKLWMDGTSNSAQVPRGWLLLTYLSPAWESIIVFTTIATNLAIRFQNFSFQNSCSSCSCRNWQSEALILGNKPIIPRKLHTTLALSLCHDFDHALKKKDSLTLILW